MQLWVVESLWHLSWTTDTIDCQTFQFLLLHGACGTSVSIRVCAFSPSYLLVRFPVFAVQPTASAGISQISWTSCSSIDIFSGFMDEVEFTSLSDFISDPVHESLQAVRDGPDVDQVSLYTPPDGPGLGSDLGFNAADILPLQSEVNAQSPGPLHHTDVPRSKADVNKALFEARLECPGDAAIKFQSGTGVMSEIFNGSDDIIALPELPAEYTGFPDQQHATVGSSASASASERVSGRDLELLFYSFAIHFRPDKDLFGSQEVLWKRAIDKWLQIFEVMGFPGQSGLSVDYELHFADELQHGTVLWDASGVSCHALP